VKTDSIFAYTQLISVEQLKIPLPQLGEIEIINNKIYSVNESDKSILRFKASDSTWTQLTYPSTEEGELILHNGRFYFKSTSKIFLLDAETLEIIDEGRSIDLLENSIAWNHYSNIIQNDCGAPEISRDKGVSYSSIFLPNSYTDNVGLYLYNDEYHSVQENFCEAIVSCPSELDLSSANAFSDLLIPNNTHQFFDKIITVRGKTIFRSLDNGAFYDSVQVIDDFAIGNDQLVYAVNELVLVLNESPRITNDFGSTWLDIDLKILDASIQDERLFTLTDQGIYEIQEDLSIVLLSDQTGESLTGSGEVFLLGDSNGDMFRSTDLGLSWSENLNLGIGNFRYFKSEDFYINYIKLGPNDVRAFLTLDNGLIWHRMTGGPLSHTIPSNNFINQGPLTGHGPKNGWAAPGDGYLYAFGGNQGFWRTKISDLTKPIDQTDSTLYFCFGDQIIIDGFNCGLTDQCIVPISAHNGCDSSYTAEVIIFPSLNTTIDLEIMEGDTVFGEVLSADTSIVQSYTSVNGCDSTIVYDVTVLEPSSLTEQHYDDLILYPNPTSGVVNIDSELPISNISLYNLQGKKVGINWIKFNAQFEINDSPAQVLFLQIILKNGATISKELIVR